MKLHVTISIIIFVLSFYFGFTYETQKADVLNKTFTTPSKFRLEFTDILRNNLTGITKCLIGCMLFGAPTVYILLQNGFSIGYLTKTYLLEDDVITILAFTVPHGIFEIPAIIIAGAAGFKIPYEIIRYLAGKKEQILTKEDIKEYLTLALISIILIVIAAFVEAYITPKIAEYFLR
jgi:uncharacterized membrane protein SpoIIM required for sporulation